MKQLLILSGKGGTGKTTVAGAFIRLSSARAYADCDIDAPNLHLTIRPAGEPVLDDFFGMEKAVIDADKCVGCGLCKEHCRFHAVHNEPGYSIDPFACEGCAVCEAICPAKAISMQPAVAGALMLYQNESSVFSTAQLKMGGGTSGKLVSEVKRRLHKAVPPDAELAILDGSPGIGCPVIASISGVSMVLVVAEPSVSGVSDLERIVKTAQTFHTPLCVCVNKADTDGRIASSIEQFCAAHEIPFVGRIPFDPEAVRAINRGETLADAKGPAATAVREVFGRVMTLLNTPKDHAAKNAAST